MDDIIGVQWNSWHGHPDALFGLALIQGAYLLGVGPLRKRYALAERTNPRQVATFTLGVLVIFVALLSPIHELSDTYLFSAHMVQHLLLTLIAPPLLILGTPNWLIRPLIRSNLSFSIVRYATRPVLAFVLFNLVFSIWHIPSLYNQSVSNHAVHVGEHLLFIGAAILMWWPIVSTVPELPRLSSPLQMLYLFLLSVAQLILFAPITFSREPIYQWYVDAPRIWTISPLVDQQLGGIIMKMGGGAIFMALLIVVFLRWFNQEQNKSLARPSEPLGDTYHSKITTELEDIVA